MINLEYFKSDQFVEETGVLFCGTTQSYFNILARNKTVEQYRRFLQNSDFTCIETFIKNLIRGYLEPDYWFSYEPALVALAIILAEYEHPIACKFFSELEVIHASGGCRQLPMLVRIAKNISEMRDELSSLKNRIRLDHVNARFLPVNELHHFLKVDDKQDKAIAVDVLEDSIILVMADFDKKCFSKELFKANNIAKPDFNKPYITDYGQTVGFGNFGEWEAAVDSLTS